MDQRASSNLQRLALVTTTTNNNNNNLQGGKQLAEANKQHRFAIKQTHVDVNVMRCLLRIMELAHWWTVRDPLYIVAFYTYTSGFPAFLAFLGRTTQHRPVPVVNTCVVCQLQKTEEDEDEEEEEMCAKHTVWWEGELKGTQGREPGSTYS